MMDDMDERIKRINELYHKSQAQGLTEEEKEEQARLRKEYVASVRNNLRSQLDSITIENPDGSRVNLGKNTGRNMAESKLTAEKKEIRAQMLKRRNALDEEERVRAGILLTERILGHQWFYRSDVLLAFAGYGGEIDTAEIIREALRKGKRVYLPRVMQETFRQEEPKMEFFRIHGLEELQPGYRGIPEPSLEGERYVYRPEEVAHVLMLMPGVAFDSYRNRIGYGKGFYDRYLADKKELQLRTVGVGFRCQLARKLPCEENDIRPYQVICV